MATGERFGTIFDGGTTLGLGPAELLHRFADHRDEGAFAALVDRHGPMVLATCRRILPDHADADDAFQATFLVLARKASSLSDPDRLAPWLHGVARRVAVRARTRSARRSEVEGEGRGDHALVPHEAEARELRAVLDEELARLPAKYRDPLVLCYLEGLTHDEAANQLDWPVGTVRSRLAGGRDRLRGRLTRRGFGPGALALLSPATTPVSVVSRLLQTATVRLIFTGGSGKGASSVAALLAQGVLTSMMLAKIQTTAIATLAVATTLAAGTIGVTVAQQKPTESAKPAAAPPVVVVPEPRPDSASRAMTPAEIAKHANSLGEELNKANQRIKALEAQLEALGVHQPEPIGFLTIGSTGVLTRSDPSDPPSEATPPPPGSTVPVPPTPPGTVNPPATLAASAAPGGPSENLALGPAPQLLKPLEIPPPSPIVPNPYGDSFVMSLAGGKKILIQSAQHDWIAVVDPAAGGQKVVYRSPDLGSKLGSVVSHDTFQTNGLIGRTTEEAQAVGLVVEGPRINQGAALCLDDNQWYPVALTEPLVNGKLDPIVSAGQVLYTAGRYWYAFSPQAKRWDTLELKQPLKLDNSEYGRQMLAAGMQIHQGGMIVPEGDILHLFSAETGQWSHVNFKQAQ